MCSRGVFQLRNVKLQFCDWGGSSTGVRKLLEGKDIDDFLEKNPAIKFSAYVRTGSHPCFYTEYINGWECTIPLRNFGPAEILDSLIKARNQFGHRALVHSSKKVITSRPSIQGEWKPNLWGTSQVYEEQVLRKIPEYESKKARIPRPKYIDRIEHHFSKRET